VSPLRSVTTEQIAPTIAYGLDTVNSFSRRDGMAGPATDAVRLHDPFTVNRHP
jgi:hypothetical protein